MKGFDDEMKRGYRECKECDSGIELLEAGFDVKTHVCAVCKREVADRGEFFGAGDAVEILGKD